jgi:hypothetical protein
VIASGASFTTAATPSRTDLVVEDIVTYYTFTGWKINNVGAGLNANTSVQMPGSDTPIVIWAQWQAMNYNLNGGGW